MAAPDLQSSASDDLATVGAPPAAFDGQRSTFAEDPRWADYRPQWWVLPAIGAAMLLAMLVTYLGLRYGQDAIALSGVGLFGLATCALIVAGVRYTWLLGRDLSGWRRSVKRAPKV